jgi:hypothetical protein
MPQWEYKVVPYCEPPDSLTYEDAQDTVTKYLNGLGAEGWELIQISDKGYIFKRKVS